MEGHDLAARCETVSSVEVGNYWLCCTIPSQPDIPEVSQRDGRYLSDLGVLSAVAKPLGSLGLASSSRIADQDFNDCPRCCTYANTR